MIKEPTVPTLTLARAVGLVWLIAVVAVPLISLAAAPLGTLLGLHGPCSDFEPVLSAALAVNVGVPAGIALTLVVFVVPGIRVRGEKWIRVMLALYAVAAVVFTVYFSGMCK